MALYSTLELLVSAKSCTSSAFCSHHLFSLLWSSLWALTWQSLHLLLREEQFGWFCQSVLAFLFSSSRARTASSLSSNQSWWSFSFGPITVLAVSVFFELISIFLCPPVGGRIASNLSSRLDLNSSWYLTERSLAVLKACLMSFGRLWCCGRMRMLSLAHYECDLSSTPLHALPWWWGRTAITLAGDNVDETPLFCRRMRPWCLILNSLLRDGVAGCVRRICSAK